MQPGQIIILYVMFFLGGAGVMNSTPPEHPQFGNLRVLHRSDPEWYGKCVGQYWTTLLEWGALLKHCVV